MLLTKSNFLLKYKACSIEQVFFVLSLNRLPCLFNKNSIDLNVLKQGYTYEQTGKRQSFDRRTVHNW
jgi:hypothetical protein